MTVTGTSVRKDKARADLKKTPYARILRAYKRGTGIHLTAKDVEALMSDEAIRVRAEMDADGSADEDDYE